MFLIVCTNIILRMELHITVKRKETSYKTTYNKSEEDLSIQRNQTSLTYTEKEGITVTLTRH